MKVKKYCILNEEGQIMTIVQTTAKRAMIAVRELHAQGIKATFRKAQRSDCREEEEDESV